MPLYKGAEREAGDYSSKFLRLKDQIFVSEPNLFVIHDRLAEEEGILVDLKRLRIEDPTSVDGGQFRTSGAVLFVYDSSSSLKLPTIEEARTITLAHFVTQSPGYKVTDQGMYHIYHR